MGLTTRIGALAVRLDLLKKNFMLSLFAATVGVIAPIALSYMVCYLAFGYGKYPSIPKKS
jgi:Kef-type K+ transport system membrane component KefB